MQLHVVYLVFLFSLEVFSQPLGDIISYSSPNGYDEKCIAVKKFPGSEPNYSESDINEEKFFCNLNFYSSEVALCPKIWSTSPGTMIYDPKYKNADPIKYELELCRGRDHQTLAKYKQSMNQKGTSGTFSTSSLLYYHFSRYFRMDIHVPVSVYRSMDRQVHFERVIKSGVKTAPGGMISEGWKHLESGARNPSSYYPKEDLYTDNDNQIYGILLDDKGERYGFEINGTRESGWGEGQSRDFQKTIPYLALSSTKNLLESINEGISKADKRIKAATGELSNEQAIFWMKELTEITLLDYIFSQQDRVGNIDYRWYWYWTDEAGNRKKRAVKEASLKKLSRTKMAKIASTPPEDIARFNPVLLQRTQLNDNDAGAKKYSNFAKKTQMIEKIRHYSPNIYQRLITLNKDIESKGPLYVYLEESFGLNKKNFEQMITNISEVTKILRKLCEEGSLRFDLDPKGYIETGKVEEYKIACY